MVVSSWASRVAAPPPAAEAAPAADGDLAGKRVAVLDANALIDTGPGLAEPDLVCFTTAGVIKEVRDAKARALLAAMPALRTRAPTQAALRAIRAFAQKTGDLHALSEVDVGLLALTYTLEAELHGVEHVRSEPAPVLAHRRQHARSRLPGWGNDAGADWSALDAAEQGDTGDKGRSSSSLTAGSEPPTRSASTTGQQRQAGDGVQGWDVAKRSRNAFRRAERKGSRQAAQASAESVQHAEPHSGLRRALEQPARSASPESTEGSRTSSRGDSSSGSGSSSDTEGGEGEGDVGPCAGNLESARKASNDARAAERMSQVALVSRDFPVQNVALQMGLRLETKGGAMLKHVQRAVLRCDGCRAVYQDTSKLFCASCGHASLARVTVTVGPDGVEQYGVRKKHVLRGTRFPLPKPRGGRASTNPILSEDVYNARVRRSRATRAGGDEAPPATGQGNAAAQQPAHVVQALAYLKTNWRNNPNERKSITRSNRRR